MTFYADVHSNDATQTASRDCGDQPIVYRKFAILVLQDTGTRDILPAQILLGTSDYRPVCAQHGNIGRLCLFTTQAAITKV